MRRRKPRRLLIRPSKQLVPELPLVKFGPLWLYIEHILWGAVKSMHKDKKMKHIIKCAEALGVLDKGVCSTMPTMHNGWFGHGGVIPHKRHKVW